MRYFMLETIRQYAREKLFDAQEMAARRDRHFTYFLDLSEKMWVAFLSYNLLPMVPSINNEAENLRAALQWGLENHSEENVRLAANFCMVTSILPGAMGDGVAAAKEAVERLRSLAPVSREQDLRRQKIIARALFAMGMMGMGVGDNPFALKALREGIALCRITGDRRMLGYSLEMYCNVTSFLYMPDREETAREGFAIFSQEVNDAYGLNLAYMNMAIIAAENGNESEKQMYLEKLKKEMRAATASFQTGIFELFMGKDEAMHGNYAEAKKIFQEAENLYKQLGSPNYANAMRSETGHAERLSGNLPAASDIYQETIRRWQELGNRSAVAHELECFGFIAIAEEQPERAGSLFGAAEALREQCQSPMTDDERIEYDQAVALLHGRLAEAECRAAWAQGRGMAMERAVQFALDANQ
jgi:non-specific serine/threonine protein kinase